MSSLKTLVIVGLLAAVGYGVYVSMTRSPRPSTDPGANPTWSNNTPGTAQNAPKVQVPGPGTAAPQLPSSSAAAANSKGGGIGLPFSPGPASAAGPSGTPPVPALPGSVAGTGPSSLAPPPAFVGTAGPSAEMPRDIAPPSTLSPPPGYPAIAEKAAPPSVYSAAGSAAGNPQSLDGEMLAKFTAFMQSIQAKLDEGHLDDGLKDLTMLYNVPELPPAQARQITQLLDQVAGTVIYSRHYPLEPPYKVQSGDRLDQIAQRYNVPWELLARINGLRNPERLTPGQELKVVRGPFNAVINLDRYEMTLMLQDRYAGRFPIGIGRDKAKLEGTYTVRDKIVAPIYQGPDGATAGAGEANNPLGRFLLDLGNQVGIHGTSDRGNVGRAEGRGSICLSDRDIDDVFGILSIGSRVVIQR